MKIEKVLENQITLNEFISHCSEAQAATLLHAEMHGRRRHTFIMRIYARYNRLRGERERVALLRGKDLE